MILVIWAGAAQAEGPAKTAQKQAIKSNRCAGLITAARGITARYATVPQCALLSAADRVSRHLADTLYGKRDEKIIKLNARQ